MANRYATHIRIGGCVPVSALPDLLSAIQRDGVTDDWAGGPVADSAEELRTVIDGLCGEPLSLYDEQHAGWFDALERFCMEHQLVFVAHSSAGAEADAELRWWAPGMDAVRSCAALEDGSPVISVAAIAAVLEAWPRRGLLRRIAALAAEATPPPLPPLTVGDDARLSPGR